MASKPLTLVVTPRGKPIKNLPSETQLSSDDSIAELYKRIAAAAGTSIHRLRVTKGSDGSFLPNNKDVTIQSTGLRDRSSISVKDLGLQISWRTVFVIEYLGPILIHPLLYYLLAPNPPSQLQTLSLTLITLHFLKREVETLFIHRFSLATMPWRNLPKNSFHYWVLSGLLIAYFTYIPSSQTATSPVTPYLTYSGLVLFVLGELGNLNAHLVLRGLRGEGSADRGIPQGLGFGLVTCPNYMFEAIAWIGVALVNRSWATVVFIVVAVGQMAVWAKKKESRYRKEFGGRYKKKKFGMLPGIV